MGFALVSMRLREKVFLKKITLKSAEQLKMSYL